MITPTILDWPSAIVPAGQMFYAGGQSVDGGFTTGGTLIAAPEAGGRAMLQAQFSAFGGWGGRVNARLISWLFSKIANQTIWRFPIARSPQLVSAMDLGLDPALDDDGIPWDNDQPFDNGFNWLFEPAVEVTVAALEGSTSITLDLTAYGDVLQYGHLIGHHGRAYHVDEIDYPGDGAATLTVSPPLREDVGIGDLITFRPTMLCTVQDPSAFRAMFAPAGIIVPGSLTMLEALP